MTMSQADALDLITKLRAENVTWPRIGEALKTKGYVSARTGKPIGHLMVRHMYEKSKKITAVASKKEAKADVIKVKAVDNAVIDDIKKLLNAGLSPATQKRLLLALTSEL